MRNVKCHSDSYQTLEMWNDCVVADNQELKKHVGRPHCNSINVSKSLQIWNKKRNFYIIWQTF